MEYKEAMKDEFKKIAHMLEEEKQKMPYSDNGDEAQARRDAWQYVANEAWNLADD